jgi:hypothetical protein
MDDFTPIDAGVAHAATIGMEEAAKKYRAKKPDSSIAESFERKPAQLKVLRHKILDRLPSQFHEHRKAHPDCESREEAKK